MISVSTLCHSYPARVLACLSLLLWGTSVQAQTCAITSPTPGSTLSGGDITFEWSGTSGFHRLNIGTEGPASTDIFGSGLIDPGITSITVSNVPDNKTVSVWLYCQVDDQPDLNYISIYEYNADIDQDGVENELDAQPEVYDSPIELNLSGATLTLLSSGRVANLVSEPLFISASNGLDSTEFYEITNLLYEAFSDDFDFIILGSDLSTSNEIGYFGTYFRAQNQVSGIGVTSYDSSELWGSSGKLQGAIHLSNLTALRGGPSLHELAHNWGNFLASVPTEVSGHWGYSNIGGQLGGWQPGSLEDLGNGTYRARNPRSGEFEAWGPFANGGNGLPYSDFELYLMGLLSFEDLSEDIKIANGFQWQDTSTGVFSASSITTIPLADVIALDGERLPDTATSQKSFKALYVVISAMPLTPVEWAESDHDVYDFQLDGDDGDSAAYNFWEATRGLATIELGNLDKSLKALDSSIWPFPYNGTAPGSEYTLSLNSVSFVNSLDGLIYSCVATTTNGEPTAFQGIEKFDMSFKIVSSTEATIKLENYRQFNPGNASTQLGEVPDCSGSFDFTTSTYSDVIQMADEIFEVKFQLLDAESLEFRLIESNELDSE